MNKTQDFDLLYVMNWQLVSLLLSFLVEISQLLLSIFSRRTESLSSICFLLFVPGLKGWWHSVVDKCKEI